MAMLPFLPPGPPHFVRGALRSLGGRAFAAAGVARGDARVRVRVTFIDRARIAVVARRRTRRPPANPSRRALLYAIAEDVVGTVVIRFAHHDAARGQVARRLGILARGVTRL